MDYKPAIIDALTTLEQSDTARGERFAAAAYKKVLGQLKNITGPIRCLEDLTGVNGIGAKMKLKLGEIFSTGKLRAAEEAKADPDFVAYNELLKIYGVGPVKARQFVDAGINGVEAIRKLLARDPDALTSAQKLGLKYYEDTQERIERNEIDEHRVVLQKAFGGVGLTMEIVGSYRRGAVNSGDIDVLVSGPAALGKSKMSAAFKKAVDSLEADGYLLGVLARGPTKTLAYAGIERAGQKKGRRLDLLLTDPEEYPYAILYFTGSDQFNIAMRRWALDCGYTMNEHGMRHVDRAEGSGEHGMVSTGDNSPAPPMKCERDIFDFLGLAWVAPTERRDGTQVVAATVTVAAPELTDEEKLEALRAGRKAAKKLA
jgi:DNA polymerase/3'-5' exonuclease PolX